MIKKIKKEDLLQILKEYDYMFRYDTINNNFKGKDYIHVIGEIKGSPKGKKTKIQLDKYLGLIKTINKKNEEKNIYYMLLYIFDDSYGKFWLKTLFKNQPMIIGYIPKIYEDNCFKYQKKVKLDIEEKKKEYLKSNLISTEIIKPNFVIKNGENEKKNMFSDKSINNDEKIESKEITEDKDMKGEPNKNLKIIIKKEDEFRKINELSSKGEFLSKKKEKIKKDNKNQKPEKKVVILIKGNNIINLQNEIVLEEEEKKSSQNKDINIYNDIKLLGKKINKSEENE